MESKADKRLLEAVVYSIGMIEYRNGKISGWNNLQTNRILDLLAENPRRKEIFELAIDIRLKKIGRACFQETVNSLIRPDLVSSPEALAYALMHVEFTRKELQSLEFYPGDSISSLILRYRPWELPTEILKNISTWQPGRRPHVKGTDVDWGDLCC